MDSLRFGSRLSIAQLFDYRTLSSYECKADTCRVFVSEIQLALPVFVVYSVLEYCKNVQYHLFDTSGMELQIRLC